MIHFYVRKNDGFLRLSLEEFDSALEYKNVVWVDILEPKDDEIRKIETIFGIDLPNENEREEIELSSRYWEDSDTITINSYFFISFFFVQNAKGHYNESASFVLKDNILFTLRNSELKTFNTLDKILLHSSKKFKNGFDIFIQIFEIRIDQDADLLEYASKESDEIRKALLLETKNQSMQILQKIATFQEFMLKVRQSIFDKRRILTALAKSQKPSENIKQELFIMMEDIDSLVEFISTNENTLDNLQNLFLAQTNIEQNKIIKLFTVANVVLMPPTLIASIYGMNFKFMPELEWSFGYPLSIAAMIVSGIIPLIYFRNRGWL